MSIKLVSDTIDRKDINKLISWLSSDPIPRLTKGPLTKEFEEKWAEYIGSRYSVFVNSGSSAILLTLYALLESNRLKNNKIVVPGLSWLTDISSCIQIGLQPVLCDCNLDDLSIDLNHLEKIFKEENPSALILVSVLGLVPKMEEIIDLCQKYNVILLEDVCESMGSEYKNKKLGKFGLASFYSFYYGHTLSTIEGGLINTDDKDLYDMLLMLRSHGWVRDLDPIDQKKYNDQYNVDDFSSLYTFYYPGFNLRSTDLQAFLGLCQIPKLDEFKQKRNNNFLTYKRLIHNNFLNISQRENDFISNFAYPIVNENRKEIVKNLMLNNIEVRPLIAGNLSKHPFWLKKYGKIDLQNCDIIHSLGFYIPNHQDLTTDEITFISNIINKH